MKRHLATALWTLLALAVVAVPAWVLGAVTTLGTCSGDGGESFTGEGSARRELCEALGGGNEASTFWIVFLIPLLVTLLFALWETRGPARARLPWRSALAGIATVVLVGAVFGLLPGD